MSKHLSLKKRGGRVRVTVYRELANGGDKIKKYWPSPSSIERLRNLAFHPHTQTEWGNNVVMIWWTS